MNFMTSYIDIKNTKSLIKHAVTQFQPRNDRSQPLYICLEGKLIHGSLTMTHFAFPLTLTQNEFYAISINDEN